MPASSQASSELSTASLAAVRRAFLGLSKPSRCLFFAKNSLTDMSRCFAAIDSAVTARRFGCSPVSLTLGIFVCSSILPDFTLVFMTDRSGPNVGIRPDRQRAECSELRNRRASRPAVDLSGNARSTSTPEDLIEYLDDQALCHSLSWAAY